MTAHVEVMELVARLKAAEQTVVLATVVRTVSVTAAKAGAKAIIRPDGSIVAGWIGGGCARGAVLKAARAALAGHSRRQPGGAVARHPGAATRLSCYAGRAGRRSAGRARGRYADRQLSARKTARRPTLH